MVYDPAAEEDTGVRTLVYVVSGSAEVLFSKEVAKNMPSRVLVGDAGVFLGGNFLLGDDDDPGTAHLIRIPVGGRGDWPGLQASSEVVHVSHARSFGPRLAPFGRPLTSV